MPRALFPDSLPPPGGGVLDSITNISPTLLNATVFPRSTSLLEASSCPPPPKYSVNSFPYSSLQVLPQTPPYKNVLAQNNDNAFPCLFSSPQRLDYSVLDNLSTEWHAPAFEVHMNLQPIVVDLHTFIQQRPARAKQQCPEKDDILYFPPNVVPTTYTVKNGKKKVDQGTNSAKHLHDTNCPEISFTVMPNRSRASADKFGDGRPKHHKYTI